MKCPPERLLCALLDPRAMVERSPPNGFVAAVHSIDAIRVEMCHLGWQESLAMLAARVEADVG